MLLKRISNRYYWIWLERFPPQGIGQITSARYNNKLAQFRFFNCTFWHHPYGIMKLRFLNILQTSKTIEGDPKCSIHTGTAKQIVSQESKMLLHSHSFCLTRSLSCWKSGVWGLGIEHFLLFSSLPCFSMLLNVSAYLPKTWEQLLQFNDLLAAELIGVNAGVSTSSAEDRLTDPSSDVESDVVCVWQYGCLASSTRYRRSIFLFLGVGLDLSLGSATYSSESLSLEPADASVIDAVSQSSVAPSWRGVWSPDTSSEAGFPVGGPSFGCNEAISSWNTMKLKWMSHLQGTYEARQNCKNCGWVIVQLTSLL